MSVCFGAGALGLVPGRLKKDKEAFEFMKELAARGLSHGFREIIGDRVAEFKYRKGAVEARWMNKAEYAPWIKEAKSIGGSAPWSTIPAGLPGMLMLLPGFRGGYNAHHFALPGSDENSFEVQAAALRVWVENLEPGDADDEDDEINMSEWFLNDLRFCREHRLIWHIGE